MMRLRLGVILVLLSWFPFAQILLFIAHNQNLLTDPGASEKFRALVWAVQIIVGFIGLWLAGKIAVLAAKKDGWRQTPANLWELFWHGTNT